MIEEEREEKRRETRTRERRLQGYTGNDLIKSRGVCLPSFTLETI
jgi:hypothetical protein